MFGLGAAELLIIIILLAFCAVSVWLLVRNANEATTIERVASGQKFIIYAVLATCFEPLAVALVGAVLSSIVVLLALVLSLVGLFRLGSGMGHSFSANILLAVLMFVPLANIITLLVLNSRATKALRAAGYKVGLLGASPRDTQIVGDKPRHAMKTLWQILGGIGLFAVIVYSGVIGKVVGTSYYAEKKEGSIEETLWRTASEINAKLPIMVDSETRLDSTVGINKTFRYNYTLVNQSASSVPPQDIINAHEKKLINNVCTSKIMQIFVKNGVTVSYAYYSNQGNEIVVISVPPAKCGRT